MAQVLVDDLDPIIVEKLETLARRHGRSLQAELKYILEQAVQTEAAPTKQIDMAAARERIKQVQAMYAGRTFTDSVELLREDRER